MTRTFVLYLDSHLNLADRYGTARTCWIRHDTARSATTTAGVPDGRFSHHWYLPVGPVRFPATAHPTPRLTDGAQCAPARRRGGGKSLDCSCVDRTSRRRQRRPSCDSPVWPSHPPRFAPCGRPGSRRRPSPVPRPPRVLAAGLASVHLPPDSMLRALLQPVAPHLAG